MLLLKLCFGFGGCTNESSTKDNSPAITVDAEKIVVRDGLNYTINSTEPFTGKAESSHPNGQLKSVETYKNGKAEGHSENFFENGQYEYKGQYLNGEPFGEWILYRDKSGTLKHKCAFNDAGELTGESTAYYNNGMKRHVFVYDSDRLITCNVWKHNGEKCNESRVEQGRGQILYYSEANNPVGKISIQDGRPNLDSLKHLTSNPFSIHIELLDSIMHHSHFGKEILVFVLQNQP